jgi:hypothetical protein
VSRLRAAAAAMLPRFEVAFVAERACLVMSARLPRAPATQAALQCAVYAMWALLIARTRPFRPLDARLPLSSVTARDVLNRAALAAQLVPLATLAVALLADGRSAAALGPLLATLVAATAALLVAAWLACTLNWRAQLRELARLRWQRAVHCAAPGAVAAPLPPAAVPPASPPMREGEHASLAMTPLRSLTTPRQRARSSIADADAMTSRQSGAEEGTPPGKSLLREVLVVGASPAGAGVQPAQQPPSLLAMRTEITPRMLMRPISPHGSDSGSADDALRQTMPSSRGTALLGEAQLCEARDAAQAAAAEKVPCVSLLPLGTRALVVTTSHRTTQPPPATATAAGLAADEALRMLDAAVVQLAALRGAAQRDACRALSRCVEAATCDALAQLQQSRVAALQCGAPALLAATERDIAALERAFTAYGFDAWLD